MDIVEQKMRKRSDTYLITRIYSWLAIPCVKMISKTKITPNNITVINFFVGILNISLLFNKIYMPVALGIQIVYFLDVIDGSLARYTGNITKFGAKLDNISDRIFYNGILLALGFNNTNLGLITVAIIIFNLHAIIATFYILPKIKKLGGLKRFGIKKIFWNKGIILGMDLSFFNFLVTLSIITNKISQVYYLIIILYIIDIVYRFIELRLNLRIKK